MVAQELTFEATSHRVEVGGLTLHYNEAGESDSVLIALHGSGPGASGWSNFKGNLPALAAHFRTLLVDLPGFGESDKPRISEAAYGFAARAVRNLMDDLGIQRADFLGNSYGGGAATRFALDYPERSGKLVLMGPAGVAHLLLSPEPSEGRKLLWDFFAPPGPSKEKLERFVRVMVWNQDFVTADLLEERWKAVSNPEALAGFVQAAMPDPATVREFGQQQELWREIERLENEVLLIWGRDDRVVPLDAAFLALKRLRNARLHVFSRCGHWAQVEKRAEFNRLVVDFLTH
jgi:4,5:9,10-diseco-3-hydroxy-5,9,17-trioxoandrosta-1(10),2-diene-4-oate hydrolase